MGKRRRWRGQGGRCAQVDADGGKDVFVGANGDGFAAHHELQIIDKIDGEQDGPGYTHEEDDPVVPNPEDANEHHYDEGEAGYRQEASEPAAPPRPSSTTALELPSVIPGLELVTPTYTSETTASKSNPG